MTSFAHSVPSAFIYGLCVQGSHMLVEEIRPKCTNDRTQAESRFINTHSIVSINQVCAQNQKQRGQLGVGRNAGVSEPLGCGLSSP